ncbi:MAG TPA: hypothetical protein VJX92_24975 [Methylomirabilota bacterium]|nr:hypothetical protein [Methylomirabilota bacterium]
MWSMMVKRRVLVKGLAGALLVLAADSGFGTGKDKESEDKQGTKVDKADGKKGKGAQLTVVVVGGGKKIQQAEVLVKFPPSIGGEATQLTDGAGAATFKSAGIGTAKVRVLATGWESVLQEVVLKEGAQQVTITLKALQEGTQPADTKQSGEKKR